MGPHCWTWPRSLPWEKHLEPSWAKRNMPEPTEPWPTNMTRRRLHSWDWMETRLCYLGRCFSVHCTVDISCGFWHGYGRPYTTRTIYNRMISCNLRHSMIQRTVCNRMIQIIRGGWTGQDCWEEKLHGELLGQAERTWRDIPAYIGIVIAAPPALERGNSKSASLAGSKLVFARIWRRSSTMRPVEACLYVTHLSTWPSFSLLMEVNDHFLCWTPVQLFNQVGHKLDSQHRIETRSLVNN
jgi:hypothetical protein